MVTGEWPSLGPFGFVSSVVFVLVLFGFVFFCPAAWSRVVVVGLCLCVPFLVGWLLGWSLVAWLVVWSLRRWLRLSSLRCLLARWLCLCRRLRRRWGPVCRLLRCRLLRLLGCLLPLPCPWSSVPLLAFPLVARSSGSSLVGLLAGCLRCLLLPRFLRRRSFGFRFGGRRRRVSPLAVFGVGSVARLSAFRLPARSRSVSVGVVGPRFRSCGRLLALRVSWRVVGRFLCPLGSRRSGPPRGLAALALSSRFRPARSVVALLSVVLAGGSCFSALAAGSGFGPAGGRLCVAVRFRSGARLVVGSLAGRGGWVAFRFGFRRASLPGCGRGWSRRRSSRRGFLAFVVCLSFCVVVRRLLSRLVVAVVCLVLAGASLSVGVFGGGSALGRGGLWLSAFFLCQ